MSDQDDRPTADPKAAETAAGEEAETGSASREWTGAEGPLAEGFPMVLRPEGLADLDAGPAAAGAPSENAVAPLAANQNSTVLGLVQEAPLEPPRPAADAELSFDQGMEQSRLDLADVLTGAPDSANIDSYLLAISHGDFSTLLVDTDGGGNFTHPDLVLEISGVDWDSSVSGQLADLVNDSIILVV